MKHWKDILVYKSVKVVKVKDWKLGLLYYGMLIGITFYVIYHMIKTGSYLDQGPPIGGSVRLSAKLNKPNTDEPDYCRPSVFNPDGCLYWSAEQMVYPYAGELNTIFVTTRVSIYSSTPNAECSNLAPTSPGCKIPSMDELQGTKKVYYIADVENLTFQIDHSVRTQASFTYGATLFKTSAPQDMVGKLISSCDTGDVLTEFDEIYRKIKPYGTKLDVISMNQLLAASSCQNEFSLSAISTADGAKPQEDIRSSGIVISIPISYTNRQSNVGQLKYQYLPVIINGSEFQLTQTILNEDGSVTYLDRHGIRIVFAQTGTIGIFNPLALILNFVAALALFKVATILIDLLMLYVMPKRKLYKDAKFQETEDIREEENLKDNNIWPEGEL